MAINKTLNWLLFLLLSLIWGSSFILMKHSKEELSASQIAALRIFSAGVVFIPFAFVHLKKVNRQKIFIVILSGITGNLLPAFLYAKAIAKNIDSSLASMLNSLTPVFVVIIAVTVFRDKIRLQKVLGVLIGFLGLIFLFFSWRGISFDNFKFLLLILLATISYGININVVAHFLRQVNPLHIASISIAFMAIPSAIVLWQENFVHLSFHKTSVQWAIIEAATLGIVGSAIATSIFYVLIKRGGSLFASLVTYAIPFVGIFWGVMDGEMVTVKQVIGLGIILVGVYLVNKPDKQEIKSEIKRAELVE